MDRKWEMDDRVNRATSSNAGFADNFSTSGGAVGGSGGVGPSASQGTALGGANSLQVASGSSSSNTETAGDHSGASSRTFGENPGELITYQGRVLEVVCGIKYVYKGRANPFFAFLWGCFCRGGSVATKRERVSEKLSQGFYIS